jgi:hypothetical protein
LGPWSFSAFVLGKRPIAERDFFENRHESDSLNVSGLDPDTEADGAGRSADDSAGESSARRRRSLIRHRRHAYDSTSGAEGPSTADEAWHNPRHLRIASDSCDISSSSHGRPGSSQLQPLDSKIRAASTDAAEEVGGNASAAEPGYVTESEAGELMGVDGVLEGEACADGAAAAVATDGPAAAGGWFRRPMLWAGVKRGIRRRAVPELM